MEAESVFVVKSPSELEASSNINSETKETSEPDSKPSLSCLSLHNLEYIMLHVTSVVVE